MTDYKEYKRVYACVCVSTCVCVSVRQRAFCPGRSTLSTSSPSCGCACCKVACASVTLRIGLLTMAGLRIHSKMMCPHPCLVSPNLARQHQRTKRFCE